MDNDINARGRVGTTYQIVVGNIGTVLTTQDHSEAVRTFHSYVTDANNGYGRAAGEYVAFLRNGDIVSERPSDFDE